MQGKSRNEERNWQVRRGEMLLAAGVCAVQVTGYGMNFESVMMGAKEVLARWLRASRAQNEDRIYGQRLAEKAKMHSCEAFKAFDDPWKTQSSL